MPNITDAIIEQYQHPRIKLVVGLTTIYEDDIVSGSFNYRCGVTGGGKFAPGGCVVSSCSFTLWNRDGTYTDEFQEGDGIAVYIGYGATPQTATYDPLCVVYVSDVKKRNYKIQIQAYDKLRTADKTKFTSYSFPMTIDQLITAAAGDCNLTVNTLPGAGAGGSISVDLRDGDGNQPTLNMTCRQAIAAALLISGNFGYVNTQGALVCGWFSSNIDARIGSNKLMDYSISDSQSYTGVQVAGQTPAGTTDRLYVLSSAQFLTEDNKAAVQSRLYDALVTSGLDVRIGSFTILCNPNIKPGMKVQLTAPQAGSSLIVPLPVTSMTIRGSLKATFTTETISADEADDLRETSDDYATKDYVDNQMSSLSGGSSQGIYLWGAKIEDETGKYARNLPLKNFKSGIYPLFRNINAAGVSTPTGLNYVRPTILATGASIPGYSSIKAMYEAQASIITKHSARMFLHDFTFPVKLPVEVSGSGISPSVKGFCDCVGWYDDTGYYASDSNRLMVGVPTLTGYKHGGTVFFTKIVPSDGFNTSFISDDATIKIIPFMIRSEEGVFYEGIDFVRFMTDDGKNYYAESYSYTYRTVTVSICDENGNSASGRGTVTVYDTDVLNASGSSVNKARKGAYMAATVTAASGYTIAGLTVTTSGGDSVEVNTDAELPTGNTDFYFVMPDEAITVKGLFQST